MGDAGAASKPIALFRADANAAIGFGHVSRCLAIADDLVGRFRCALITREPSEMLNERCTDSDVEVLILPTSVSLSSETSWIAERKGFRDSILCIDGYEFSSAYQKSAKSNGFKLVVIDDLKNGEYFADIIINHAPDAHKNDYICASTPSFCLGLDYLMLHHAFWSESKHEADGSTFVSLGGSDPGRHTERLLRELLNATDQTVQVVLGGLNPMSDSITEAYGDVDHISFHRCLSPSKMVSLMTKSSRGICAASTVSLEYSVCGRDLYMIKTAENQSGNYDGLLRIGRAARYPEDFPGHPFSSRLSLRKPDFRSVFESLVP